jgi:hypothetical protein
MQYSSSFDKKEVYLIENLETKLLTTYVIGNFMLISIKVNRPVGHKSKQ